MSGKVSFEGIGEVLATFYTTGKVEVGKIVTVKQANTVGTCTAGEGFCGVVVSVKDGCAAVQTDGVMQASCTDSAVKPGVMELTADGKGGVKKGGDYDAWVTATVINVENDVATIKL